MTTNERITSLDHAQRLLFAVSALATLDRVDLDRLATARAKIEAVAADLTDELTTTPQETDR